jgi:hypothetical protein
MILLLLLVVALSGCASRSVFHDKDLPEPFKRHSGMQTVSSSPDTPYQALDWRLDE